MDLLGPSELLRAWREDRERCSSFLSAAREWPLRAGGSVKVGGRLAANTLPLILAAVLDGQGLALLPRRVVAALCDQGRLVPVLPDAVGGDLAVSVVYADREFIDAKVRVFVDRAVASLKATFEASP